MSAARKNLIALGSVLLVAALTLGILRWQADKAATEYAAGVKANVAKYARIYKTTPQLRDALAKVDSTSAALPKDIGKVPRAQKMGPLLGAVYRENTRILRREISDSPEVRSVPLGARLSPDYENALADARDIDRRYGKALGLSVAAAEFYPISAGHTIDSSA